MDVGPLIEGNRDRGNIGRWRRAGATEVVELVSGVQKPTYSVSAMNFECTEMH
jgi:hypothetical protein